MSIPAKSATIATCALRTSGNVGVVGEMIKRSYFNSYEIFSSHSNRCWLVKKWKWGNSYFLHQIQKLTQNNSMFENRAKRVDEINCSISRACNSRWKLHFYRMNLNNDILLWLTDTQNKKSKIITHVWLELFTHNFFHHHHLCVSKLWICTDFCAFNFYLMMPKCGTTDVSMEYPPVFWGTSETENLWQLRLALSIVVSVKNNTWYLA